jgi:hypothetical protein
MGGDALTRTTLFSVTPLAAGRTCDLAIEVLPKESRRHVCEWRLVGPDNRPFGQSLRIDVRALPAAPPPPSGGETPFSAGSRASQRDRPVGSIVTLRSMGFLNEELNQVALAASKGDLTLAVAWLLNHSGK